MGGSPGDGSVSDFNSRIKQIAQVLAQLDDSQVPRNIRMASKDAVEKWLLNEGKDMDVRLGMTASILDEIFKTQTFQGTTGPCACRYKPRWRRC